MPATQGLWYLNAENDYHIVDHEGYTVANASCVRYARLIAAAPELLALVRAWRISEPLSGYTDAIDAVLAKAEGVQP